MEYLKNVQYYFTASFGTSRVGQTVTWNMLNADATTRSSGFTIDVTAELGNGTYGAAITFTEHFTGVVRAFMSSASLNVYNPVVVLNETAANFILARKMTTNRWKIENNELKFYDDDNSQVVRTMELRKDNSPNNGDDSDERIPV
jgi:hypothetical protein